MVLVGEGYQKMNLQPLSFPVLQFDTDSGELSSHCPQLGKPAQSFLEGSPCPSEEFKVKGKHLNVTYFSFPSVYYFNGENYQVDICL